MAPDSARELWHLVGLNSCKGFLANIVHWHVLQSGCLCAAFELSSMLSPTVSIFPSALEILKVYEGIMCELIFLSDSEKKHEKTVRRPRFNFLFGIFVCLDGITCRFFDKTTEAVDGTAECLNQQLVARRTDLVPGSLEASDPEMP